MELDLRLIRYAVILADELHFGRAAQKLLIAQQTLSSQIAQLEARLGVVLFIRDSRHVELTPAGVFFVDRGRRLLAEARAMIVELNRTAPLLRVDVITEGLPTTDLIARQLRSRLPEVTLEVVQGHGFTVAVTGLLQGRTDLAFGRVHGLDGPLPKVLQHQLVRLESMGVALPAEHKLAGHDAVRMEDLAEYPLLLHIAEEATDWLDWNEELIAEFGLEVGYRMRGHGRSAANAAVTAYHAPALGPLFTPVADDVVVRPVVDPVPVYPFSAVWRSGPPIKSLDGAITAIRTIAAESGWLDPPPQAWWMPAADHT
ncbi:DNA-binding transcriptional LysR family regulator [Streptomyces sp. LBL]|uniref:LysR family transcriptional regulator n=1 Tax=Streptomyces sp. LBL TaxID=2940562 RepID=UPI0024742986|nr:LysR family transcriptional regulator [Streptomyces sp. LBL]MDH6626596.1 DNA-binding transcriptional LysR family regulator [Streptomyces sp. LBL]